MKIRSFLTGVSLLCLMTATAGAVATDKIDEAKQQAEVRGELRGAIINARNAVKSSPTSVDAHEKLAQLLLRSGDGVGAEKEARAMRDNGADATRWAPILSRGFAMQGVPERTLREVRTDGLQGAARGAALAAMADANTSLKRYDEAERQLKEAETLQPTAVEPRIATARLYLTTNRPAEALAKAREAQALAESGEVWLLIGAAHTQLGQPDEAIAAFSKAIEKEPRNAVAYAERAAMRLSKGDEAAGLEDADRALAIAPNYATPSYLKALVMARRNELKEADALLQKVTPRLGDLPRGWFLLAAVKNGLGELEQAQVAIGKFQSRYPEDVAGQRLAGIVALRRGDLPKAIDALKSVTTLEPTDAQSFDLLGRAYAMSGDATTALAQFQKAAALAPKDATLSTRAAVAQLQTGDEQGGIRALEQALVLDPGFGPAAELVFFTYLRDEKFDAAAGVIDQFAQKNPDNPSAGLFRGLLANAKGDAAGADAAYRQTIAKYPKFMPARLNVAEAQLAGGHPELAEATYNEMLAIEPRNLGALSGLSQIYLHSKRTADLVQLWDKAVKAGPDSPQMVSALIDAQLQNGDKKGALVTARNFANAHGNDADALLIRAHVEAAADALDDSVVSLRRAIELQPKNVNLRRELAGLLVRKNELDDAEKLLQETLRMAPANDALLTDLVALSMKRSPETGLRTAERLAADYPDRPAAQALPGDALAVAGKFDEAAQRFAKLNELHPSAPVTVRLANALVRTGKSNEAIATLGVWAAKSPKDMQVRQLLAGLLLETGALDRARGEYEKLDSDRRDDPVVLNNLAWIYQQQNNPAASSLARRAVLLRPNDPTVLDTYGWILTSSGKPAEGVRYLERAVFAQPANKDMSFHLGATHARLGNKAEALKLLRPLVTEKATYQSDVQLLVKQLES